VEQDNVEAVRLYRLASAQEYPDAQFNLGFMIEKGLGVPQDREEAIRWYRLAASNGRSHAATMALGRLGA
jgi:TPR repeat protein